MKLRTIVKIAITSSVVLLCSGFALYSFFRLSAAEGQKDFNLYELVPSTTSAVFVTDDVLEFVAEVDELTCSKNQQYLHVSKLFSYLKQYLYTLQEEAPHGRLVFPDQLVEGAVVVEHHDLCNQRYVVELAHSFGLFVSSASGVSFFSVWSRSSMPPTFM